MATKTPYPKKELAMSFYAIGISPISDHLRISTPQVKNVSLADDITGAGKLDNLKTWWETVISEGKKVWILRE